MQLRGKQKRYLRAKGNTMKALFSVGKLGVNQNWLHQVENVINRRELVKINVLQNSLVSVKDVKQFIQDNSKIEVVQVIGKTLLLFAPSNKAENRHLSIEVKNI